MENNILLETGNGEVEVVEFLVNKKHYCINVLKIKEIVSLADIIPIPGEKPEIAGKSVIRDMMVTVVDLHMMLEKEKKPQGGKFLGLLCEFNQSIIVFLVDEILGIRRVKWTQLEKPDYINEESLVVANILLDKKIIMMLDFERMLILLSPKEVNRYYNKDEMMLFNADRSGVRLILADDSRTIRALLNETLSQAGYTELTFFDDGLQAYTYLADIKDKLGDKFTEKVDLLITDIEMPNMDGYTLTKKVKEDLVLASLPVVIFSSLITDDLYHKGKVVKADAQISKPDIGKLVTIVDHLVKKG